jgi:hypothetical protein
MHGLPDLNSYSAIILMKAHEKYRRLEISKREECLLYDLFKFFAKESVDHRLWQNFFCETLSDIT